MAAHHKILNDNIIALMVESSPENTFTFLRTKMYRRQIEGAKNTTERTHGLYSKKYQQIICFAVIAQL